ncbi:hypothetical protein [Xenorhabdus sp. KJ12.1]|uniref:hypothetical protein n=1 Tax=Xenorhabdus sp. KJ12.1 TaxID=1851571 RepID=UPI000C0559C4|nr:hypothetical protein [Xenorhabdus sp. KJ12.1]PHM72306.1 hypothetical protein Xekj_00584 [Xenorhabdus sp. KJ12.1]
MNRTFSDKSVVRTSIAEKADVAHKKWFQTTPDGKGLPEVPGVYRFRVPMEHSPDEKIEFLSLLRWRRHGMKNILLPVFEYFVDDEFITIPEGTEWAHPELDDPQILSNDSFPIVQPISNIILPCPFCKTKPILRGRKIDLETGDKFTTSLPYRFNQFWFVCCEWIAPAPRHTIKRLIDDWNNR